MKNLLLEKLPGLSILGLSNRTSGVERVHFHSKQKGSRMRGKFNTAMLAILCAAAVTFTAIAGNGKSVSSTVSAKSPQTVLAENRAFLPNVIVVKFKERRSFGEEAAATGIASIDALLNRYRVTVMKQFVKESFIRPGIDRSTAVESIYNVFYAGNASAPEVARAFAGDPHVEYAEPKYLYEISDIPNDALYSSMPQFPHVQAPAAWDVVKGAAGNVIIAVVDGGTYWNHQDLLANIWINEDEIPNNGIDDDNNGFIDDVYGWNFANNSNDPTGLPNTPENAAHGTHVAGSAAAVTNNGIGVASISWNCVLMPINAGSPTSDRSIAYGYDGIAYAAANGAQIINCSWGGTGNPSSLEQDVINFAYANGALVVAAAGNSGVNNDQTPHYPSNYKNVLAVGATGTANDTKASFSNYGVTVDVFAPGVNIYSTVPNNGYQSAFWSGTSMASPMAAGLAGLVKTLNPGYTVDQLREQVRVTCDPIDAANPNFSGRLGKGRINALRAVTDFSIPAVRIKEVSFTDSGGNGIINAGETIDLTVQFINYLAAAGSVAITLTESDNNITVTSANATIPAIASGGVESANFQFTVANGTPDGYILRFVTVISSGAYSDRDFFTLTVNPPPFMTHNTGTVQASITLEGNIGFTGFDGTPGVGFVHDGDNYLFEGGLMIATGVTKISDCIRGADGQTQDEDFRAGAGEELAIISPGAIANEEGSVLLVDSAAVLPIGISVLQETFADNRPQFQDFVIFKYTIVNNNSSAVSNLYAGLFFDWDINLTANDYARYDVSRKMGYVLNSTTNPTKIAATRLLSGNAAATYRSIHNPNELYDGFTNTEKWNFLSGGIQTQSLDNVDVSTLLGTGPLSIPAQGSAVVAFAVIGAANLAELNASADSAQAFWDNPPTGIEPLESSLAEGFQLYQNYPNPFNPSTSIRYTLPQAGEIVLEIFNLLGEKVRTLVEAGQLAGSHQAEWDGRNDAGAAVASGVYIYRLRAGNVHLARKMLLLR